MVQPSPRHPVPGPRIAPRTVVLPVDGVAGCAACGRSQVTEIAMTLTDGSPVRFRSCRFCEHRTWEQAGRPLAVDVVLAKATKSR